MTTSVDRSLEAAPSEPCGATQKQPEREVLIGAVFADLGAWINQHTRKVHAIDEGTLVEDCLPDLTSKNDIDFAHLTSHIAERWGVEIEKCDWEWFLQAHRQGVRGVQPNVAETKEPCVDRSLTLRRLAEWIATRIGRAAFEDLSLLDKTWRTAAAYRRMEGIARQVRPLVQPFVPSTAVLDRLRGQRLRKFWSRVRCLSSNRIPSLKLAWGERIFHPFVTLWMCGVAGCLISLAAFNLFHVVSERVRREVPGLGQLLEGFLGLLMAATLWLSLLVAVLGPLLKLTGALVPVLPHGIRTFRDFAELVAGERGGWCEGCGYDLTGNTTGICPECGRTSVVQQRSGLSSGADVVRH